MRVFSRSFDDDSDCRVVAGVVVVVVEILLSTNMTMTAVVGPLRRLPNHDALEIISSFSLFFFFLWYLPCKWKGDAYDIHIYELRYTYTYISYKANDETVVMDHKLSRRMEKLEKEIYTYTRRHILGDIYIDSKIRCERFFFLLSLLSPLTLFPTDYFKGKIVYRRISETSCRNPRPKPKPSLAERKKGRKERDSFNSETV